MEKQDSNYENNDSFNSTNDLNQIDNFSVTSKDVIEVSDLKDKSKEKFKIQTFKAHLKSISRNEWIFILSSFFLLFILTYVPLFIIGISSQEIWLINLSFTAALFGIFANVIAAKKSRWNYIWGIFHVLLYGSLAFFSAYYGDFILNLFYYLPLMIAGFLLWQNHEYKEQLTDGSRSRKLTIFQFVSYSFGFVLFFIAYSFLLKWLNGINIYLDTASTTLSLFGMLLMLRRYREQYIIWFFVNVVSTLMWILLLFNIDHNVATTGIQIFALPMVVMWSVYTIISVYGYIKWS